MAMADKRSKRNRGCCTCCLPKKQARRNKTYQLKEMRDFARGHGPSACETKVR